MTRRRGGLVGAALALGLLGQGCYQGEWRLGTPVPMSGIQKLVPVRTVESWELRASRNGNTVELRATSTQRCRMATHGKSTRTDVGTFERVGGNWWKGAAIISGIGGGAGVGVGLGGTVALLDPKYGAPIAYAGGGAIAAGGLASCLASISRATKVRLSFCGVLTGLGASVLLGGLLASLPASQTPTVLPSGSTSGTTTGGTTSPLVSTSLIEAPTFQKIMYAGGGLVGASILTGIIGHSWQGTEERMRTVDTNREIVWDTDSRETACDAPEPLRYRAATLKITAEHAPSGLGSAENPLVLHVQPVGPAAQMVDLFWIRQALPQCGVLSVKVIPDVVYVPYTDEFQPETEPNLAAKAARPRFTQVLPESGLQLPQASPSGQALPLPQANALHGLSAADLHAANERCKAQPKTPSPDNAQPAQDPASDGNAAVSKPVDAGPRVLVDDPGLTPGLLLPPAEDWQHEDAACSREAHKARLKDCEHQCGRNLAVTSCLVAFRGCAETARSANQPLRERALCETTWQDCVSQKNISPSSFRACAEACGEANTPLVCRETKRRDSP
ncbi:MAG TPA: hypothetical protein PKE31_10295 [Pseudomonadota bacterium]|nr:hypothetical protein [Pseudomonadota bacterium]